MRAVDTNVLIRALFDGEGAQFAAARAFVTNNEIFVPVTVILESAWVLKSAWKFERNTVIVALRQFAGLPTVKIEDPDCVHRAFALAEMGFDIADALHLARIGDCTDLVTFDRPFVKAAEKLDEMRVTLLHGKSM